jgi:hypothetical protein
MPKRNTTTASQLSALRAQASDAGITLTHVSDYGLRCVVEMCNGHVGIAGDALAMPNRPAWLHQIVGPVQFTHQDATAAVS